MDPNRNPFNPGAGVTPPELAGRSDVLDTARVALERIKRGRHARSLMILGLRGVGKTVLLIEIKKAASAAGYLAEMLDVRDGQALKQVLSPVLRKLLLQMDRPEKVIEGVKKGLRVLRSFIGNVTVSAGGVDLTLGVDPERGFADTGNLEEDLKEVLLATATAAREADRPVAILIDELQYLSRDDLSALIRGMHAVSQEGLPLILFGAGLPQLLAWIDWSAPMQTKRFGIRLSPKARTSRPGRWTRSTLRRVGIPISSRSGATTPGTSRERSASPSRTRKRQPGCPFASSTSPSSEFASID